MSVDKVSKQVEKVERIRGSRLSETMLEEGWFGKAHPLVEAGFKVMKPPVTSSGWGTFFGCERAAMFELLLGLKKKWKLESESSMRGQMFHAIRRHVGAGGDPLAALPMVGKMQAKFLEDSKDELGLYPGEAREKVEKAGSVAMAMGLAFGSLLKETGYEKEFEPGAEQWLEVEVAVEKKVRNGRRWADVVIAGTMDRVAKGERVVVDDFKTTSDDPLSRARPVQFEPQPLLYKELAEAFVGKPLNEFRHWIMQPPTIRLKKGETLGEYCQRVVEWYRDKAVAHPHDPTMVLSRVRFAEGDVMSEEHKGMLLRVWRALSSRPPKAELWPRTGAPYRCCDPRKGECPFLRLCMSNQRLWPDLIVSEYRQEFRYESHSVEGE